MPHNPTAEMVVPAAKDVHTIENMVSVIGGAFLLYDALKKEKKSIPEAVAAGFMIYRGVKGFIKEYEQKQADGVTKGKLPDVSKRRNSNINIHARLIVKRPVADVYNFWRHLGNLPLFMEHLDSVTVLSDTTSEWKVKVPGLPATLSWTAEIVGEEANRYIGWRSVKGSSIQNAGKIEFKDAGELGTLMHVVFSYEAPFGNAGEEVARLLTPVFEKLVRNDVLGFKRYMETGTPDKLQQPVTAIYT
ncbi:SRPBCC family protein [Flavobacterium sp. RHBU_24]|uniref:SRPBCC family protein n=1 Tax=Flavobacterium sp. RHBU_24 TaxID=3391185 RepID=UPI0039854D58